MAFSVFTATDCYVSLAHTQISCNTVEGVGGDLFWSVVVGGQNETAKLVKSSYFPPTPSSWYAASGALAMALDTVGGDTLLVTGDYFGPVDATNIVNATYQNTELQGFAGMEFIALRCSVGIPTHSISRFFRSYLLVLLICEGH